MGISWWHLVMGGIGGFANALFLDRVVTPYFEKINGHRLHPNIARNVGLGMLAGIIIYVFIGIDIPSFSRQLTLSLVGGFGFESVFSQVHSYVEGFRVNAYIEPLLGGFKNN